MLGKCMKYEARAFARVMIPILIAYTVSWGFTLLLLNAFNGVKNSELLLGILRMFIFPIMLLSMLLLPQITCFLSVKRYNDVLFSDQAYLMRSLPVSCKTHIICILLNSLIWYLISFIGILIFLGVPLTSLSEKNGLAKGLSSLFTWLSENRNQCVSEALSVFLILIFIESLFFLSLTIAAKASSHRWVMTFVIFLLLRFIILLLELIIETTFFRAKDGNNVFFSFQLTSPQNIIRGIIALLILIYLIVTADKKTEVK